MCINFREVARTDIKNVVLAGEADFLVRSGLHSKRQIQDISRENCLVETRSEYVERKFGYAGKLIARGM